MRKFLRCVAAKFTLPKLGRASSAATVILILLTISATAHARYREVDTIIFNPVTDNGRYLTVQDAQTLGQWRFNAGIMMDYARKPMELRTAAGNRDVVGDQLIANINGAVGFTDWFEAGVNVPVIAYEKWADPDTATAVTNTYHGLGDVRLEMKFRLLDIDRYHIGIGILPFVTFPTVTSSLQSKSDSTRASGWINGKFASNEDFTGGAKLLIEGDIVNRVWLSLNAGYQLLRYRQYYAGNSDAWVDDVLTLSGGAHVRINDSWRLIAELYTETVAKPFSNAFQSKRQTPTEVVGAVRYQPQRPLEIRGLTFQVGGGRGIFTSGVGAPDFRIFGGVSFRKPRIVELPPPPAPAEVEAKVTEKVIITQKIHFEFNKSIIRAISFPILNDVVELLNKTPSIKRIEIGGHCDAIGNDAYNDKLSDSRAKAVVKYLVDHGVAASRLVAKGYGKRQPIADNNTTEGRAKNRRVEFTVLE